MMRPFIIKRQYLQADNWTHGNWRQYVATIDEDIVVICRRSAAPALWGLLGLCLLALCLAMVILHPREALRWDVIAIYSLVGFVTTSPAIIEIVTPWRWMVQLYPAVKRGPDGRFMRDYLDG